MLYIGVMLNDCVVYTKVTKEQENAMRDNYRKYVKFEFTCKEEKLDLDKVRSLFYEDETEIIEVDLALFESILSTIKRVKALSN